MKLSVLDQSTSSNNRPHAAAIRESIELAQHCDRLGYHRYWVTDDPGPPLPPVRCLTKEQAAAYLGIGVTLPLQLRPPPIKFGPRSVWDADDQWLEDYKARGVPERSWKNSQEL